MSFHFPDYFLMGNTRASKALPGMSHDEWLVILDRSVQGSQLSPQTSMKSQWFTKHVIPLLVWKASKSQEQEMERNFYGGSLGEAAERVGKSIGWELWNLALCTGFSASRDLTVATFGPFPPRLLQKWSSNLPIIIITQGTLQNTSSDSVGLGAEGRNLTFKKYFQNFKGSDG